MVATAKADDCDVFLVAGESVPEIDQNLLAGLSKSSRVYVSLVNHYVAQKVSAETESLLSALIASKDLVHPFKTKTDTLSGQLDQALQTVYSKISPQDWMQIKLALAQLLESKKAVAQDRSDKSQKTEVIFNPNVIFDETFPEFAKSLDVVNWLVFDGRVLLLAPTLQKTFLYELKNGELKAIKAFNEIKNVSRVNVNTVAGRVFISAVSRDTNEMTFFELIRDELHEVDKIVLEAEVTAPPVMNMIGAEIHVVLGVVDKIQLYTLGQKLKLENELELKNFGHTKIQLHSVENHSYITFTAKRAVNPEYTFNLLEVKNKKLELLDTKPALYNQEMISVVSLRGKHKLHFEGYLSNKIHLYEIIGEELKEITSRGDTGMPNGQYALLSLAHKAGFSLQAFTGDQLSEISYTDSKVHLPLPRAAGFESHGRQFLARTGENSLIIEELTEDGQLQSRFDLPLRAQPLYSADRVHVGDETYLAVSVSDGFRVIKIFNAPTGVR